MERLAQVWRPLGRIRRLPFTRDQLMLLMAAMNEFFLAVDIYLAHSISGTITPREWIPILFGPLAALALILTGLLALRKRETATVIASVVFLASIAVGLLGAYYHFIRGTLPTGPPGERVTVDLLIWAPPILGPLTFSLVGLWGLSAAWAEDPPESGVLRLLAGRRIRLPLSKTRAYLFMIGLGILATLISSVLDHARTPFTNPWLWVPTLSGVFATAVAVGLGVLDKPGRGDLATYVGAMLLLIAVGITGAYLHIRVDLTAQSLFVPERFLRGAPFLAPLLFADMGTLGLIALLDPGERPRAGRPQPLT